MLGMMEAILFACGDPIDIDKLAQALNTEEENVLELSRTLQAKYNKEESGIHLLQLDHTLQFAVNPVFLAPVRTALDLRSSAPLSQAAMEVLAVIAYNQPVTKAFVEQVRGVDCSGVIGSLVQKALIEERGRLDLPGKPLLYGTTDGHPLAFGAAAFAAGGRNRKRTSKRRGRQSMIVLWILLGLIALIFLLLCIPVRFDLNYNGETTVFIRYLFLKYRVLPAPEKKPESKKEKKPSEKESEEKAKEKKPNPLLRQVKKYKEAEGLTGLLTLAKDLLKATGTRFGKLLKHIKLKDFDLYVLVGGGKDAAEIAILYGEVCAGVYPAVSVLLGLTNCKSPHGCVSVDLDYSVKEPKVLCTASGAVRPLFVVHHGVQFILRTILPFYNKFQSAGKPAVKSAAPAANKKERTT